MKPSWNIWKNYHGNYHVKKDVKKEDEHMEIVMGKKKNF